MKIKHLMVKIQHVFFLIYSIIWTCISWLIANLVLRLDFQNNYKDIRYLKREHETFNIFKLHAYLKLLGELILSDMVEIMV